LAGLRIRHDSLGRNDEEALVLGGGCKLPRCPEFRRSGPFDLRWILGTVFVTQKGECDPTNSFSVNISDGIVTHPNLVKFQGNVARSGAVRASVTVQDKYAAGTGRLSGNADHGNWSGRSGTSRCSGYWTAQRN
jgi:hypothetical protein